MIPQTAILEDGTEVTLIHLVFLSPVGLIEGAGKPLSSLGESWKIACMPNLLEMSQQQNRAAPFMRSDDPRAVTCPNCKQSEQYRRGIEQVEALTRRRR